MLTGKNAQRGNHQAEQAHEGDDRSGRGDVDHGAGDGGGGCRVAAGHALAFSGAIRADGRRIEAIIGALLVDERAQNRRDEEAGGGHKHGADDAHIAREHQPADD